jgi:transcriptional regulator GlxA family with amidase domain
MDGVVLEQVSEVWQRQEIVHSDDFYIRSLHSCAESRSTNAPKAVDTDLHHAFGLAPAGVGQKDNKVAISARARILDLVRRASKRVWFLVVPGSELLDVAGPWEVLAHANDVLGINAYDLELRGPTGPELPTRHGLRVVGVQPLARTPSRLPDVAVVAGGSPLDSLPLPERRLSRWLYRHAPRIPTLVSICTGAFLVGQAGLLDGRRVTTHWRFISDLRSRFPAAEVVDEGIFVRDGHLWTSAGITAGIDLMLAFVEDDHGHDVAMAVAKKLVLFLRRSGNQSQFSAVLDRQQKEPGRQRDIARFVLEHIDEVLTVERLARALSMSPRSLTRWCSDVLGEPPAEFVRRLRVEEARRLLESTSLPLKDISVRAGLGDQSTLWRVFTQRLGVTPAEYRERFASSSVTRRLERLAGRRH